EKIRELNFQKYRFELGMKYAKTSFIRYMTALLFVISLYWIFVMYVEKSSFIIIPIIYFFGYVICSADQYISLHTYKKNKFGITKIIFEIEIIFNFILIIITIIDYKVLFSFFNSQYVSIGILIFAILLKSLIVKKIIKINKKEISYV
ncbi:hypothetical protein ABGF35_07685, partial [Helcococcus ovis]